MLSSIYVEDIFIDFVDSVDLTKNIVSHQDLTAIYSFYNSITSSSLLTQSQGNLIIKFLQKYKAAALAANLDYEDHLKDPQWKKPFRQLDLTRKIWVETDDNNMPWVCAKFPYQLKKDFDDEFGEHRDSAWDPDRKLRKMSLYKFNLIHLYEFAKKNSFEIDDTFEVALGEVEEIWQNQQDIIPYSQNILGTVQLINSSDEISELWDQRPITNYQTDALLAKSWGFILDRKPESTIEKIAASEERVFWIKSIVDFLNLIEPIEGKTCILLDRAGKSFEWLKEFNTALAQSQFQRDKVKVCFRADKDDEPGLNDWIKQQGFGGKVDEGKLLIFNHKPAKWLFKDENNVKIIATNNLYQPTNTIARDWFSSHSCVIYVGDIKPSINKETKIVEL